MSAVIEKHVQLTDDRAKRLEQLATTRGMTEDALIEEALDMLFRDKSVRQVEQEDREWLREYEAEFGPIKRSSSRPIRPEDVKFVVGTPIPPERIRRLV